MLGLIFTEFVSMVDEEYSPNMTEALIGNAGLDSGGAYTAFGSYSSRELFALVNGLSELTGRSVSDIQLSLGRFLVSVLAERYSRHFRSSSEPFAFMYATQARLQHEARKLYRLEDLPRFQLDRHDDDTLILDCEAERGFDQILLGCVFGVLEYFEADVDVKTNLITKGVDKCQRFILHRRQAKAA